MHRGKDLHCKPFDRSDKYCTAHQLSKETLSTDKKKQYDKACEAAENVKSEIWKKLTKDQKTVLIKAKRNKRDKEKKSNDRGLGSQYNLNNLNLLPPGTVLVPMTQQPNMNQQVSTNSATASTTNTGVRRNVQSTTQNGTNTSPAGTVGGANTTNQQRALNFLQLQNGTYVIQNAKAKYTSNNRTFELLDKAS